MDFGIQAAARIVWVIIAWNATLLMDNVPLVRKDFGARHATKHVSVKIVKHANMSLGHARNVQLGFGILLVKVHARKTALNVTFRMAHVSVACLDYGIRLVKKPAKTGVMNVKLIPGNVKVVKMDFGAYIVT